MRPSRRLGARRLACSGVAHRRDRGRLLLFGLFEFEREAPIRSNIMPSNTSKKRGKKGPIVLDVPITTDAREYV